MKKLIFIVLISSLSINLHATILKNGAHADQKRIDQVWKGLQKTKNYSLLLCTALDCKNDKTGDCVSDWNLDSNIIAEWARLNIIKNDSLDRETQEIIIASYFEDRQPDWGTIEVPKRIALAMPTYPVVTWVENIPGYSFFKAITKIKTISSIVIPIGH